MQQDSNTIDYNDLWYLKKQERIVCRKTSDDFKNDFDVIDEHELVALADVDVKTVRQWRTRRIGPMYISAGKAARLYFKQDILAWMRSIRKETSTFDLGVLAGEGV